MQTCIQQYYKAKLFWRRYVDSVAWWFPSLRCQRVILKSNATKNKNGCSKKKWKRKNKITLKLTTWMLLSHSVASCVQFRRRYRIQTHTHTHTVSVYVCAMCISYEHVQHTQFHRSLPAHQSHLQRERESEMVRCVFVSPILPLSRVGVHVSAWFVYNWWSLCWLSVFILSNASKMVRKMHFNDRHTY